MSEPARPLNRDRLSVLIATLLLGNVLFRFIQLPTHVWQLNPLGSPLQVQVTGTWLLVTLMVGLVCTGTNLVMHQHPVLEAHPERPVYVFWIVPGLLAGVAAYLLQFAPTWQVWAVGLVAMAVLVGLAIAAEYASVAPESPGYGAARLALNLVAYLLAFALFVLIYQSRVRSLVTATLVSVVGFLVGLDLLSATEATHGRVLLFAAVNAIVIGECTWALNYSGLSAWAGGLLLLVMFYVLVNVSHQHLLGRLARATVIEFVAVGLLVLALILLRTL